MAAFDFPATPTVGQTYEANGVSYIWSGVAWLGQGGTTPMASKVRVTVYNTPGTIPYAPPANLKALDVELFGSGGGGGGCTATAATTMAVGGGGAAGGYVKKSYNRADLDATQDLVLGTGGAGGVSSTAANGLQGATSTFKGLTAPGGFGGGHGVASAVVGLPTVRGYPTRGTGGDLNDMGGSGQLGVRFNNGNPTVSLAGYGGRPYLTGTIFGTTASTKADNTGAKADPGCGGNGSANALNQAAACDGGAGGDAFAIFTEYLYDADEIQLPELMMKVVPFLGPGLIPYSKPAGLKYLQVELWGAGGGSGGVGTTAASQSAAGAGGGGGGYVKKLYKASDLNATENLSIGAGGIAGTIGAGAPGQAGGDTTFKSLIAGGGGGGNGMVSTAVIGNSSTRGSGGSATGGDQNVEGSSGLSGFANVGVVGSVNQGSGGFSFGGGAITYPVRITGTSPAVAGAAPGGGGNGAGIGASQTQLAGAAGAIGGAIFTEFYVDIPSIDPNVDTWGDWTPRIAISGVETGITHSQQIGRWRKRGKEVTLWWDVILSNKGAASGAVQIVGNPHGNNAALMGAAGTMGYVRAMATGINISSVGCYVPTANNYVAVTTFLTTAGDQQAANQAAITNTSRFMGSVSYEVAS